MVDVDSGEDEDRECEQRLKIRMEDEYDDEDRE